VAKLLLLLISRPSSALAVDGGAKRDHLMLITEFLTRVLIYIIGEEAEREGWTVGRP
jgi:hypothetical protein